MKSLFLRQDQSCDHSSVWRTCLQGFNSTHPFPVPQPHRGRNLLSGLDSLLLSKDSKAVNRRWTGGFFCPFLQNTLPPYKKPHIFGGSSGYVSWTGLPCSHRPHGLLSICQAQGHLRGGWKRFPFLLFLSFSVSLPFLAP